MKNKKLENSIKALVQLYIVVIGAAISLAVARSIEISAGLRSLNTGSILLFVAFICTLFPFFHGALRHLDDAFIENDKTNIKTGALVIDFSLLFLHALAFVVLAQLLQRPAHFSWVLVVVLGIDVIWGIFAHFGSSSSSKGSPESKWTMINLVFIAILLIYLVYNDIYLDYNGDPVKLSILLAIMCVLRSAIDYAWCRNLYFPADSE